MALQPRPSVSSTPSLPARYRPRLFSAPVRRAASGGRRDAPTRGRSAEAAASALSLSFVCCLLHLQSSSASRVHQTSRGRPPSMSYVAPVSAGVAHDVNC